MSKSERANRELPPHPVLTRYYKGHADRHPFVVTLFDSVARDYDWICNLGSFGTGGRYRAAALKRAGLARGARLLDVATGTGLMARSALELVEGHGIVVGLDPSRGMLAEARRRLSIGLVQGRGEALPFDRDRFDVVSVGYALRHVADLGGAFGEFWRVLKPGGRLLVLEMTRPRARLANWLIRQYLQTILPLMARLGTPNAAVPLLTRYFWATIEDCVPPEAILEAMRRTGFSDAQLHMLRGFLCEYVGTKPGL